MKMNTIKPMARFFVIAAGALTIATALMVQIPHVEAKTGAKPAEKPAAAPVANPDATATAPSAGGQKLAVESGKVEFLAIGKPSFMKVRGVGPAPTGSVNLNGTKASGEFSFDLASLDTEISLRNEHMKNKYLEVAKHPKATIRFKDVDIKEGKTTIPAELELHGEKKPVSMETTLVTDGSKKKTKSEFKIKLSDYAIAIPSHLGITVADEVTVIVESVLK